MIRLLTNRLLPCYLTHSSQLAQIAPQTTALIRRESRNADRQDRDANLTRGSQENHLEKEDLLVKGNKSGAATICRPYAEYSTSSPIHMPLSQISPQTPLVCLQLPARTLTLESSLLPRAKTVTKAESTLEKHVLFSHAMKAYSYMFYTAGWSKDTE